MEKALFTLSNYIFDKVEIDFSNKSDSRTWCLDVSVKGLYNKKTSIYNLVFVLKGKLGDKKNNSLSIQCSAAFKIMNDNNDIPDFFYANSIAILFPYVRAFISTVTLQANIIPPVILPTYNLVALGEELKRNTTIN